MPVHWHQYLRLAAVRYAGSNLSSPKLKFFNQIDVEVLPHLP